MEILMEDFRECKGSWTPVRCELCRLLRLAGCPCHQLSSELYEHVNHVPEGQTTAAFVVELEAVLRTPLTLREWSRVAVRRALGIHLNHRRHELPLPTVIRDYLLLGDVS